MMATMYAIGEVKGKVEVLTKYDSEGSSAFEVDLGFIDERTLDAVLETIKQSSNISNG